MDIVLFPHTHWDREWYKPFQSFRIRLIEVMEQILEDLENGTLQYFYLDGQTVVLEDYFEIYPEKEEIVKKFIKEKKLFVGPWYVLADEFLVSGESLIRNLFVGIKQANKLGCESFIGYMPDSFGHNSEMPRILSSFGIKNALLWRGAGDKKSEFIWKSGDGSSVLTTCLTEGYFITENFSEYAERIAQRSISDKVLLPVGGDHIYLRDELCNRKVGLLSHQIYFSNLENFRHQMEIVTGELRDNARNPILPGTLSTRLYLKQMNAVSTWKLSRLAEPLQVFLGTNRKNELDYAWNLLLKNHPHDSICGCSVDEVHEENVSRYKQVDQISDALIERSLHSIIKDKNKDYITVCNMSNYPYSGLVKIKEDAFPRSIMLDTQRAPMSEDMRKPEVHLAYVENIPPFSVRSIDPSDGPEPLEITDEIINLHKIIIRSDVGDTYNFCPIKNEELLKAEFVEKTILENTKLIHKIRIKYRIEKLPEKYTEKTTEKLPEFSTEIITKSGSKQIEFITTWENTLNDHIVQVCLDLPEKVTETVAENTFGLIKRQHDPGYRLNKHIPAAKGQELKTNTAPMQRFVYTQGLGVLTEGLPEYEVSGSSLLITLLRSTGKLSKLSLGTRNFPAGPPLDTPGAQCQGRQRVRYAICKVGSPEELFKEADEFMGCTLASFGQVDSRNFIKIDNPEIILYGTKIPETRKGAVIRLLNVSNVAQKVKLNAEFLETNSMERPITKLYNINEEITFNPNELKTLWLKKLDQKHIDCS